MKIMRMIAVVVAVLGAANVALAQSNPDPEVNTGSVPAPAGPYDPVPYCTACEDHD
jgi:hypothetical protein